VWGIFYIYQFNHKFISHFQGGVSDSRRSGGSQKVHRHITAFPQLRLSSFNDDQEIQCRMIVPFKLEPWIS
jgi:hypothetical protein